MSGQGCFTSIRSTWHHPSGTVDMANNGQALVVIPLQNRGISLALSLRIGSVLRHGHLVRSCQPPLERCLGTSCSMSLECLSVSDLIEFLILIAQSAILWAHRYCSALITGVRFGSVMIWMSK